MTQYLPLGRNSEATEGNREGQMNWTRKQCPGDRRRDRMLRSWNLQKHGPRLKGAAWRFKLFIMLEGLILKLLTTPLDM